MPIKDLLWACPLCAAPGGVRDDARGAACRCCGARFRRASGADIVAEPRGGGPLTRSAAAWLDALGAAPEEGHEPPGEEEASSPVEQAILRISRGPRPIRGGNEFLGWGERFGPRIAGTIELADRVLRFRAHRGPVTDWNLIDITAVQPTSNALQVKTRGRPVVLIRFLEGSVRLWQGRLQYEIRELNRESGLGPILEFQPRITTR